NWCLDLELEGVRTKTQVIKVTDTEEPVINCLTDAAGRGTADNPIIIGTNGGPFDCTADADLPLPVASDNCDESPQIRLLGIFDATTDQKLAVSPEGLTAGCSRSLYARYDAIDLCGNVSEACTIYFDLRDDDVPTVVVDEFTVVPLTEADLGKVNICAENLNSGSYDNCSEELSFLIATTENGNYQPCLELSCADFANGEQDNDDDAECPLTVNIFFKAIDDCGNETVAMVEVELQDKIAPTIVGAPDKTIECGTQDPMLLFTVPTATDNCSAVEVEEIRREGGFDCGQGSMTITWQATDACGNKATTSQTVTQLHVSDFVVSFPQDVDRECNEDLGRFLDPQPEDGLPFWPEVTGDDCEKVLVRKSDQVFESEGANCLKIIRTWEVINWCINPDGEARPNDDIALAADKLKDGGNGYMQFTQVIKLSDTQAPVISCADAVLIMDETDGCEGPVTLSVDVSDNCTDVDNISLTWQIDA
ncbi:MAG: HYR domain-containing protein, partial [Bacteroidota bacterium]